MNVARRFYAGLYVDGSWRVLDLQHERADEPAPAKLDQWRQMRWAFERAEALNCAWEQGAPVEPPRG